ncbi:MAG: ParB N-terminal domain-containing protein [Chloroflexota bacterium]
MYSTLQLHQLAMSDYERAQSKAQKRRLVAMVRRQRNDLLSLNAIIQCLTTHGQHSLGLVTVAIEQIVGSVDRNRDFDRAFLPRTGVTMERWLRIVKARYKGEYLPPVELRKVGEAYFVVDGHHRISVAREMGQEYIDAYVTELEAPADELRKLGIAGA